MTTFLSEMITELLINLERTKNKESGERWLDLLDGLEGVKRVLQSEAHLIADGLSQMEKKAKNSKELRKHQALCHKNDARTENGIKGDCRRIGHYKKNWVKSSNSNRGGSNR